MWCLSYWAVAWQTADWLSEESWFPEVLVQRTTKYWGKVIFSNFNTKSISWEKWFYPEIVSFFALVKIRLQMKFKTKISTQLSEIVFQLSSSNIFWMHLPLHPCMWWFKVYIWASESLFIGRLIWLMYKIMLHMLISFIASCPYGMDYTSTEGTDATKSMTGQLHGSRSLRSPKVTRFGVQILNFLENNIRWLVSMEGSLF